MTPHFPFMVERLFALGFRAGALLSKFALMLYITRFLGLPAVGLYGLAQGFVIIGVPVLCLGLRQVSNRALVSVSVEEQAGIMRHQLHIFLPLYVLTLAVLWGAGQAAPYLFPISSVFLGLLLTSTHLVFELSQALIYLHRSTAANAVLFVAYGLWAFAIMGLGWLVPDFRTIDWIFNAWLLGNSLALALAGWFLRHQIPHIHLLSRPDFKWIRHALWGSFGIYLAGIAQIFGQYLDRYIVNAHEGLERAGVFVMYWSFGSAVHAMIQAGILQSAFPKFVALAKENDFDTFWKTFRHVIKQVALGGAGLSLIAAVGIFPVLHAVDKPLARAHIDIFWILLLAFWIRMLNDVVYNTLYARHRERAQITINFSTLFITTGLNILFVTFWGLTGIAWAQVASNFAILSLSTFFAMRPSPVSLKKTA